MQATAITRRSPDHLFPPLTTLPHLGMGQWAIEQLKTPPTPGRGRYPITKLECPLVERECVGSVPAQFR